MPPIDKDTIKAIKFHAKQGRTLRQIATLLRCSHTTVSNVLKRAGYTHGRKWSK